jgi:hypothetical protein
MAASTSTEGRVKTAGNAKSVATALEIVTTDRLGHTSSVDIGKRREVYGVQVIVSVVELTSDQNDSQISHVY